MSGIVRRAAAKSRRMIVRLFGRGPAPAPLAGPPIDEASIERLIVAGLDREEVLALGLRESAIDYPVGWRERGNRVFSPGGAWLQQGFVRTNSGLVTTSGSLIVIASSLDRIAAFGCHGDGATVFIGPQCHLPGTQLHCGGDSTLVFRRLVTCTSGGHVDSRNGGTVFADDDQLWASRVYIATDDMHALRSAESGERLNGRGETISIGSHVWLGQESAVLGGAMIGPDSVVAFRSVVRRGPYPDGAVLAGMPARVVRTGVTWSRDDLP